MCEAKLQAYRSFLDSTTSSTFHYGVEPSILFFSEINCGGNVEPSEYPTTQDWSIGNNTVNQTPKSIIIPFNFHTIILGDGTHERKFNGPMVINDLSTFLYSESNLPMNNVSNMNIVEKSDWDHTKRSMCLGTIRTIGALRYSRFQPQSSACDEFMNYWCNKKGNLTADSACGCFADLPEVKKKSKEAGVSLPVLCFGKRCALADTKHPYENSYKTSAMLSEPCNLTVCSQIINKAPNVIEEGKTEVFCAGKFFNQEGNLSPPKTKPVPPIDKPLKPQESNVLVWLFFGVAGIFFGIFIYLILRDKKQLRTKLNLLKNTR